MFHSSSFLRRLTAAALLVQQLSLPFLGFSARAESSAVLGVSKRDAYLLTKQELLMENGDRFPLHQAQLALPRVWADRPELLGIEQGADFLDIVKYDGVGAARKVEARQRIEGFKAVHIVRDSELLLIQTDKQELLAIEWRLAREYLFRAPLPVLRLSALAPGVQIAIATPGLKPVQASVGTWSAGDLLLLVDPQGERRLVDRWTRAELKERVALSLAGFESLLNPQRVPSLEEADKVDAIYVRARRMSDVGAAPPADLALALGALDERQRAALGVAVSLNARESRSTALRERWTSDEWPALFAQLLDRAQALPVDQAQEYFGAELAKAIEAGDLSPYWRDLFLSPKDETSAPQSLWQRTPGWLRAVAAGVAGGGLATAAVAAGLSADEVRTVQALDAAYAHLIPDLLKAEKVGEWSQPVLRENLAKSLGVIFAFVPASWAFFSVMAKRWGMSATDALETFAKRVYAWGPQFPAQLLAAKALRQPLVLPAMGAGLAPWSAMVNPFRLGQGGREQVEAKRQQLNERLRQRHMSEALAAALAMAALTQETGGSNAGVDPAELLCRLREGCVVASEKEMADPKFHAEWGAAAQDLARLYLSLPNSEARTLEQMKLDELNVLYAKARALVKELRQRGDLGGTAARVRRASERFFRKVGGWVGRFGVAENEHLRRSGPRSFIGRQTWSEFKIDWILTGVLMALWGERARANEPTELTVDYPEARAWVGWTNPAHHADLGNTLMITFGTVPARLSLTLAMPSTPAEWEKAWGRDGRYDPREVLLHDEQTQSREDGIVSGAWNWFKGAVNLRRADYGNYLERYLKRYITVLQPALLMGMFCRIVLGQMPEWSDAFLGWLYIWIYQMWGFYWPFAVAQVSNLRYSEAVGAQNERFKDISVRLEQSIRLQERDKVEAITRELIEFYREHGVALDAAKVPAELLKLARERPPVPQSENAFVADSVNLAASVLSTWLWSFVAVASMRQNTDWAAELTEVTLFSAAAFTAVIVGQRALNKVVDRLSCQSRLGAAAK